MIFNTTWYWPSTLKFVQETPILCILPQWDFYLKDIKLNFNLTRTVGPKCWLVLIKGPVLEVRILLHHSKSVPPAFSSTVQNSFFLLFKILVNAASASISPKISWFFFQEQKQYFFFSVALWPNVGHCLLILEVSRSHTMTHHSQYDSSGHVISASQRPLPDNTQH